MPELWAGVDAGKTHHHRVVINAERTKVFSQRVPDNEAELLELIADVRALSTDVLQAIDLNTGGGALLIALLINHDQQLLYIPGRTVHHASAGYRGSGKSDAKDAFIIADQARMRRGLHLMTTGDEIAVDLRSLTARRYDLAADRTRAINRLCAQILEYFPALDALIEGRFRRHRHATAILSMPGIGPLLGAEILGNLRRPRRYNRRLLRAFYLSAQVAITRCSQSKAFYERKRREGKAHKQPVLALARRGPNVVWALIRDDRVFQTGMPRPAATAA